MYFTEKSIVFLNGGFLNARDCSVNLYSQSLHYGNAVFEGIKSYSTENGAKIFMGLEHFQRLKYSADKMSLKLNLSPEEMLDATYELLEMNRFTDAYIRPLVYTGVDMSLKSSDEVNLFICAWEWPPYLGEKLLRVTLSPFQRPNPNSSFVDAKIAGHYINSILAVNEAKSRGYDEALLLDMNGNVAEGPGANVFVEKDGKLFTPQKGHILPGITRSVIIELALSNQIEVVEKDITPAELKSADSAFFTGTAAEVVGMESMDEYTFPIKWENSIGKMLKEQYELIVRNKFDQSKRAM
ncbi:MAG: branched-chain amino acid aminotransferase [Melioribacteraceae bacterium]|nr:MAG: branched-chain amino acid aminotransferase [Melioribacteraceae bacterium]